MTHAISEFERATALRNLEGTQGFAGDVPDGWQQGKGAFGGIALGMLARAIVASEPDANRRLRSLSADLCARLLPGPVMVHVSQMRRGGSVTYLDARLLQNDELIARASAALATPRDIAPVSLRPTPPEPPAWDTVQVLPIAPPMGPVFARHYEFRSTGPLPVSGVTASRVGGWVREKIPPQTLDEAAIMGLLDSWWPAVIVSSRHFRAVATIGYTMQLLCDPRTLPSDQPLYFTAEAVANTDNFVVEMRELWAGEQLVALNQQTIAVLS